MTVIVYALAAVLAANGLVEAWNHGSLFAGPRARAEAGGGFLSRLLSCPFCLSYWAAAVCVAPLLLGDLAVAATADWPGGLRVVVAAAVSAGQWLTFALAAARAAQLLNDLTAGVCRTPNRSAKPDSD